MKKNAQMLKALTIAQPWAECIVSKGKNIENRSWNTKMRGFIAIHSSAGYDKSRFEVCSKYYRLNINSEKIPFGAIVGFAEISDVITEDELTSKTKKWFMGEYGFVLKNVIKLKSPIPAKGSLGFWKVTQKDIERCLDQVSAKDKKRILENLLT